MLRFLPRGGGSAGARSPRGLAVLLVGALILAGCSAQPVDSSATAPPPTAALASSSASPVDRADDGVVLAATFEVPPAPGPVKPWRGEMVQHIQVVDGYATMLFTLRNTGEEPITFLNLLYDYEPRNLYDPMVHAYWADGPQAATNQIFQSRAGRFFPSPAGLQPGEEGVYLMGGQPVDGAGQIGELKTNIKYCPTRGMDDVQSQPLEVSGLDWETHDGVTTVRGTIRQAEGGRRASPPTIGVAFFGEDGTFSGAVVADHVGERMQPGEQRTFEISGPGVQPGAARAEGWAWVR
jgi:hypothetical protein